MVVEQGVLGLGDRCQLHNTRIVNKDIDPAERLLGRTEEPCHRRWVGDVGLNRDHPARRFDLGDEIVCRTGIAQIVNNNIMSEDPVMIAVRLVLVMFALPVVR